METKEPIPTAYINGGLTVVPIDGSDKISEPDLESVVTVAAESATKNEDISHLREIADKDNSSDNLVATTQTYYVKEDGKPDFTKPVAGDGTLKEADLAVDELDKLNERNEEIFAESATNTANALELTNEEADNIAQILMLYKNNKKMNVYAAMIPSMKARVAKLCMDSSIPLNQVGMVARMMMDQFLSTASADKEYIDIEKTIERTMKIPSMVDIYMEHINDTMDVKLPAMAEAMKEKEPEKAEKLLRIRDQYNAAFLCSRLRDMYDSNARLRKLVRRDFANASKLAKDVNYLNSKTEFKMPDCSVIPNIINNIMAEKDPEGDPRDPYQYEGALKFATLLFGAASYLNLADLEDASFYYYSIKNISMLAYLGDRKSDFSAELISNIMITMYYISRREAEFNAQNDSKFPGGKQKRSVRYRLQGKS